jgi:hypothetical protein
MSRMTKDEINASLFDEVKQQRDESVTDPLETLWCVRCHKLTTRNEATYRKFWQACCGYCGDNLIAYTKSKHR